MRLNWLGVVVFAIGLSACGDCHPDEVLPDAPIPTADASPPVDARIGPDAALADATTTDAMVNDAMVNDAMVNDAMVNDAVVAD